MSTSQVILKGKIYTFSLGTKYCGNRCPHREPTLRSSAVLEELLELHSAEVCSCCMFSQPWVHVSLTVFISKSPTQRYMQSIHSLVSGSKHSHYKIINVLLLLVMCFRVDVQQDIEFQSGGSCALVILHHNNICLHRAVGVYQHSTCLNPV